jgi:hypothetical protein
MVIDDGKRIVFKAVIKDLEGTVIGCGYAEEIRGQGYVNKTSAVENAETSSIGRALASLGLSGGEYASSLEMDIAIKRINVMLDNIFNHNDYSPEKKIEFISEFFKGNKDRIDHLRKLNADEFHRIDEKIKRFEDEN